VGLYHSLERAIFERFESFALHLRGEAPTNTAKGGTSFQSVYGRSPHPYTNRPLRFRMQLGGRPVTIPVYYEDKGSQDASNWPAITFRMDGEEPRRQNWQQADALLRSLGASQQYTLNGGTERTGPDLIESIPSPDPITVTYEIRVWALDHAQAQELLEVVKRLFPLNGYLSTFLNDGCPVDYDMIRVDGPTWTGGVDPTLGEGAEGHRFYSWSLLYDIEAYEDNTLLTELTPTIKQRGLDLDASPDAPTEGDAVSDDVIILDGFGPAPE